MKINRFSLLIVSALVVLAIFSVCSLCVEGPHQAPKDVVSNVDVMTTEWSCAGASVILPVLYIDESSLDSVNLAITDTWTEFMSQFFDSTYQVDFSVWQQDNLVSIVFSGEVWTPTKAIPFAFGINYDLAAGCQLELSQAISLDEVYMALDEENEKFLSENLRYNFDHYALCNAMWTEHIHDFYFDDDRLFVVVPINPALGGYTVVSIGRQGDGSSVLAKPEKGDDILPNSEMSK